MACIVHEVEVYTIRYHAESESRRSEMMTTAWCLAHQALMVQETRHSHKEPRTALSQARSKLQAQTKTHGPRDSPENRVLLALPLPGLSNSRACSRSLSLSPFLALLRYK